MPSVRKKIGSALKRRYEKNRAKRRQVVTQGFMRFGTSEIIFVQFVLQLVLWLVINYGNMDKYHDPPEPEGFGIWKATSQYATEQTVSVLRGIIEPYIRLIKQSLRDAAIAVGLKTVYNNLEGKEEKITFIVLVTVLIGYLKQKEIEALGIFDFLKGFDTNKKFSDFKNMIYKEQNGSLPRSSAQWPRPRPP